MSFAVVVCPACRSPWAVETRHASASCPSCKKGVDLAHRTRLWEGDDGLVAQRQAGLHRAAMADRSAPAGASLFQPAAGALRHDSPAEEAAAAARGIANKGARAEMVAGTLDRLQGPMAHAVLVRALQSAGLEPERAELEVARMLAMDILMEPKAGLYRMLA
ncbi:MAG TPA: hypothetical protein VM286_09595 [Candidatus Thermoplasmatota archaeon]|nr:hypothetical protein [Candidatus Thermoplasmatota archaeon]